jgi:hypothetical protein
MKIKALIVSVGLSLAHFSYSQVIDNQDFGSAEERIVFNKQNNLDKYEGILVEYEYRLVDLEQRSENEWLNVCEMYFDNLLGIELYSVNGVQYFSALTKGSSKNHESSYTIPVDLGYKIEFSRRRYHLK